MNNERAAAMLEHDVSQLVRDVLCRFFPAFARHDEARSDIDDNEDINEDNNKDIIDVEIDGATSR